MFRKSAESASDKFDRLQQQIETKITFIPLREALKNLLEKRTGYFATLDSIRQLRRERTGVTDSNSWEMADNLVKETILKERARREYFELISARIDFNIAVTAAILAGKLKEVGLSKRVNEAHKNQKWK